MKKEISDKELLMIKRYEQDCIGAMKAFGTEKAITESDVNPEKAMKKEFFPDYLVKQHLEKMKPQFLCIDSKMQQISQAITNELNYYAEKKLEKKQTTKEKREKKQKRKC